MRNIAKHKWVRHGMAFCLLFVVISSRFCVVSSAAVKGSCYIASVSRTYRHPVTGEIADSGSNEEIGQPMVESVGGEQALIEKTEDGSVYATVRIYMTDNISNVQFCTQPGGGTSWDAVSAEVMQENIGGTYCRDYRFLIPGEDAVIKAGLFITPMGREVLFFLSFSGLQEGNTDFVVSVDTAIADTSAVETAAEDSQAVPESVDQQEEKQQVQANESSGEKTSVPVSDGARALIAAAQGLTLSDESVLAAAESDPEPEEDKESEWIQALPWEFVWQCILMMTLPALITGCVLAGIRILFGRRGVK